LFIAPVGVVANQPMVLAGVLSERHADEVLWLNTSLHTALVVDLLRWWSVRMREEVDVSVREAVPTSAVLVTNL
jgi:hypothetical protein